ncbi:MAG: phosphoenolpyruvate synthase [Lachnospiraceae bacterium]
MNRLGTKAETLRKLYQKMRYAEVLPQYVFTVKEWKEDPQKVKKGFLSLDWNKNVIVRSSSLAEDTDDNSFAGKYESVANVFGEKAFCIAVETVVNSYDDENDANQLLVQPMLSDVQICGVAFTVDPNTMGNYYVINYDERGSTSAITSGTATENRLYYRFKQQISEQTRIKEIGSTDRMNRLCLALQELEEFFGQDNLDVEFAFAATGVLYILQVRSLYIHGEIANKEKQRGELERIQKKIGRAQKKKPFLCGEKALYSVMTDWNPAEMIGIYPKALALSLYREIITDGVWAYQRDNYGYRNLRSFPLMVDFGGLPYIDVRVSFNSFVPAGLEEELSDKLVNYYLDRLIDHPTKHDKAEFDIVFSCYTFDLPERIQVLQDYGFTALEIGKIISALREVTNNIIDHKNGLWRKDYEKIHILNKRYNDIVESDLEKIEKIYWLLEDCKRYGTLPFAGLARAAFIAVQMLRSLVSSGIITTLDYESFMSEVNTVSSDMNADFQALSQEVFIKKYGHLRPGTYDIMSPRYDEAPALYFSWPVEKKNTKKMDDSIAEQKVFRLSLKQLEMLKQQLRDNGLANDILELMDFIKTAIEGREYGKFAFTRNLSMALKLIGEIGQEEGLSKEDCAFINIRDIYELYTSAGNVHESFLYSIQRGKRDYEIKRTITLPPIIVSPEDVMQFYYPDSEANYITSNRTTGTICVLEEGAYMCVWGGV